MAELSVGSEFAGHRIEGEAGRGGMGVVYRATDLVLDRLVAMKVIAPDYAGDSNFRERFQRESRIAAGIKHPHAIAIHRAGEEDGVLFITMELIEGTDLRETIATRGRLSPKNAARITSQLASALDAAHERGLVHRDIKPANVLLEEPASGPHAYLTDFGLTKNVSSESGMTKTGEFVGTMDYIAPEQVQGARLDARADVYSLGCVLYQALTGEVPYPRDSEVAKLWAHVGEPPPSVLERVPDLPPAFEQVIGRAMAKDPDERFPSAGDMGEAAMAAVEDRPSARQERTVAAGPAAPGPPASTPAAPQVPAPAQAPPSIEEGAAQYAGWGLRLAATLIDAFVIFWLSFLIASPSFAINDDLAAAVWIFVGGPLAIFLWSALPMARRQRGNGQSFSKQLVRIRVVRDSGERVTLARAALRELALKMVLFGYMGVLVVPALLNYLWPLWQDQRKAIHDLMAGTRVLRA